MRTTLSDQKQQKVADKSLAEISRNHTASNPQLSFWRTETSQNTWEFDTAIIFLREKQVFPLLQSHQYSLARASTESWLPDIENLVRMSSEQDT